MQAKARDRIKYRRPFPNEEIAAGHVIDLMYDQHILKNTYGAGRRTTNTNVVACAMALYDHRSFRNETDAKEQYGIARGTRVAAKWQPLLAALERRAPDVFATYLSRAREAKPRKGPSDKELAALREQRDAEYRAKRLRVSWEDAMREGVEKAQGTWRPCKYKVLRSVNR